jgi:hypothetical protein
MKERVVRRIKSRLEWIENRLEEMKDSLTGFEGIVRGNSNMVNQ